MPSPPHPHNRPHQNSPQFPSSFHRHHIFPLALPLFPLFLCILASSPPIINAARSTSSSSQQQNNRPPAPAPPFHGHGHGQFIVQAQIVEEKEEPMIILAPRRMNNNSSSATTKNYSPPPPPSISPSPAAAFSASDWPHPNSLFHSHSILASLISILVLVLILATVLGNLGVCLAIALVRKLKAQPANLLLISLALADFCVGLFVMPMAAVYVLEGRWVFGDFLCHFWVTADLTLCTASILNLCAISVDRHLAVTRALRYSAIRTRRRICYYICVVWVGSLLVSAVPLAFFSPPKSEQNCQVNLNPVYQIYATIISFWGPSLIMVIVYVKLWSAAKRMQRQDRLVLRWQGAMSPTAESTTDPSGHQQQQQNGGGQILRNNSVARANAHFLFALRRSAQKFRQHDKNNNNNGGGQQQQQRPSEGTIGGNGNLMANGNGGRASAGSALGTIRIPLLSSSKPQYEDKARKTLGVIMSVFIICWVPFFILTLAKSQQWVKDGKVPMWLDSLALWLGYSNSMLNPLIYCKYNREFRIPFGEMICCRFATIQDVMRNESYYMKFGSPRISESRSVPRSARNGVVVRTDRSLTTMTTPAAIGLIGKEECKNNNNNNANGDVHNNKNNGNGALVIDSRRLSSKRNSSPCIFAAEA